MARREAHDRREARGKRRADAAAARAKAEAEAARAAAEAAAARQGGRGKAAAGLTARIGQILRRFRSGVRSMLGTPLLTRQCSASASLSSNRQRLSVLLGSCRLSTPATVVTPQGGHGDERSQRRRRRSDDRESRSQPRGSAVAPPAPTERTEEALTLPFVKARKCGMSPPVGLRAGCISQERLTRP